MEKPIYKAEELLENINKLTNDARAAKIPVIYIQHINNSNLMEGTEGHEIHPELKPQKEALLYKKTVSSMFEETDMHQELQREGIEKLVLTGLLTNACVKNNCIAAKKLGYKVFLVEDAHSCRGEKAKQTIERCNKQLVNDGIVELVATKEVNFK